MSGRAKRYHYSSLPGRLPGSPSCFRILPLHPVAAVVLAFAFSSASLLAATGQPAADDGIAAPEDFAGIYLDRYVPAAPELAPSPNTQSKSRALSSYYLGLLKEQSHDRAGAVDYYRRVLKEDPTSVRLADRAARIAAQDGDIEAGLSILRESLEQNPELPSCYLVLSSFYATFLDDDKESPESIRVLKDAHARFPDNPQVIRHFVITLIGFERRDEAEEILEKALAKSNDDPAYWYQLGRVAQAVWPMPEPAEGVPDRVNKIYEKALSLAKDDDRLTEAVADYFYASEQHRRASEIYSDMIERNRDCISPREKLGRIHAINNEIPKAIEVLTELIEIHPDRPNTHKLLGHIYSDDENVILEDEGADCVKAVEHFEAFLRLSIGDASDYLRTGALMLMIPKRAGDAADLLERARFHFPDDGLVLRLLGIAYFFEEDYAGAITVFEETEKLATDPNIAFLDDELYYRYGAAHERLGHFELAAELFHKAISIVPAELPVRAARIYNYLGYMWLEQDMNIEEGGELIIRANELSPDDGAFVDSLGWYYFKIGKFEEALAALLRAEELLGEEFIDAVVVDHIAQSYFGLKKFAEAIAYGERAANLDPENADYPRRLEEYRKAAKEAPGEAAPPSKKSEVRDQKSA